MTKQNERRKLELKRERLRQLTELSTDEVARVAGGGGEMEWSGAGRVWSRCCR
jgi:hypothetical protein